MIADPLRLFDFCMETDYGCAVIVTTAERAADLRHTARVHQRRGRWARRTASAARSMGCYNHARRRLRVVGPAQVGEALYRVERRGPGDLDAAMVYDHFTADGADDASKTSSSARRARAARTWPTATSRLDGPLPVNTHGGNLAEAYAHGMNHVEEAVKQVRGTALNQVDGAENVLVIAGRARRRPAACIAERGATA